MRRAGGLKTQYNFILLPLCLRRLSPRCGVFLGEESWTARPEKRESGPCEVWARFDQTRSKTSGLTVWLWVHRAWTANNDARLDVAQKILDFFPFHLCIKQYK